MIFPFLVKSSNISSRGNGHEGSGFAGAYERREQSYVMSSSFLLFDKYVSKSMTISSIPFDWLLYLLDIHPLNISIPTKIIGGSEFG
jgi:hypothetical protein